MGRILLLIINLIFLISCGVGYMEYAANHNKSSIGSGSGGGTGNSGGVRPTYQTASITGETKTLTVTFDLALDEGATPVNNNFTVTSGGAANSVTNTTISGTTVTLTLTNYVGSNETVSISYNGNFLKSSQGSEVENFSVNSVTNNSTYHLCGEAGDSCYCSLSAANACYDDFKVASLSNAKYAITRTKGIIKYISANGSDQNPLWIENVSSGDAKVLAANGLDNWQETLVGSGRVHSQSYFTLNTDSNYVISGTLINIKGRVCPTNVFYDEDGVEQTTDFTNTGMCLYYSDITGGHPLTELTTTIGVSGIINWSDLDSGNGVSLSWYESNHYLCGEKGMRLPTLFETTATSNQWSSTLPTNIVPILAGSNGVPRNPEDTWTWTATGNSQAINDFCVWQNNVSTIAGSNYAPGVITCVLP